jgi:hypothetical protein
MISGAYRVLDLHAQGGGVEHHDGIPAVQNVTKQAVVYPVLYEKCIMFRTNRFYYH